MKIISMTDYYILKIRSIPESPINVSLDDNLDCVCCIYNEEDVRLFEVYFARPFYTKERVISFWMNHDIQISDSFSRDCLHVKVVPRNPLPLLKQFILKSLSRNNIVSVLKELANGNYSRDEYAEFYDYFEENYMEDYDSSLQIYDDPSASFLQFIAKAEKQSFIKKQSSYFTLLQKSLRDKIMAVVKYIYGKSARILCTYEDGEMRSTMMNPSVDEVRADIIQIFLKNGKVLLDYETPTHCIFEMFEVKNTDIIPYSPTLCKQESIGFVYLLKPHKETKYLCPNL